MSVSAFPYGVFAGAVAAAVVTVSGEAVADIDSGSRTYRARVSFITTGIVQKREDSTTTAVDASTDWVIPNSAAPDDYEIRFINRTGVAPNGSTNLTVDVWAALSTDRHVEISFLYNAGLDSDNCNFTIEVRKGGSGGALDSAAFSLDTERLF